MKNFFAEFKKFITRGNVVDMAVGVIVGSSFTAIVNGMSNFILKPLVNWLLYYPVEKWLARCTDVIITINEEDYQRAIQSF